MFIFPYMYIEKENEIKEFIISSQSVNKNLAAILLAEPVIPIGDSALGSIHEDYSLTPPNVCHPDTKNAHLDTAILYQHSNAYYSISPYACQEKHLGLTWIICYYGITSQRWELIMFQGSPQQSRSRTESPCRQLSWQT